MSAAQDYATHIVELLEPFAQCQARRMFGGHGIFREDLMFALIADGSLYLKADDENRERFLAEGCEPFSYYKQDKQYRLSYYLAPESFFDDEQARMGWARLAFDAALRNPAKRKSRKS